MLLLISSLVRDGNVIIFIVKRTTYWLKWNYNLAHRSDETVKLIEARSAMEEQMVKAKKKKPSWKDIAASLAQHGFTRTPEQCSSMWSSLVKKYEVETHFCLHAMHFDMQPRKDFYGSLLSCQSWTVYGSRLRSKTSPQANRWANLGHRRKSGCILNPLVLSFWNNELKKIRRHFEGAISPTWEPRAEIINHWIIIRKSKWLIE